MIWVQHVIDPGIDYINILTLGCFCGSHRNCAGYISLYISPEGDSSEQLTEEAKPKRRTTRPVDFHFRGKPVKVYEILTLKSPQNNCSTASEGFFICILKCLTSSGHILQMAQHDNNMSILLPRTDQDVPHVFCISTNKLFFHRTAAMIMFIKLSRLMAPFILQLSTLIAQCVNCVFKSVTWYITYGSVVVWPAWEAILIR